MKRTLCVFNRNRESFLALHVVPAETWWLRMRGLLGRSRMAPEDGMWLCPCNGIHTFGMRFAVDLIYLDSAKRVICLVEHLRPFSISPIKRKCASVLEMRTRTIYRSHTQIGDELLICPPEDIKQRVERNSPQPVGADGRE